MASPDSQRLPSQQRYLEDLSAQRSGQEAPSTPDATCGICLDHLAATVPDCCTLSNCKCNATVTSLPCRHLFHYYCITRWHCSIRPERNTCPNCSLELFLAEPLDDDQIRQMTGQSEQLQPDEEFIPWDLIAMTVLAEEGVNKMVE